MEIFNLFSYFLLVYNHIELSASNSAKGEKKKKKKKNESRSSKAYKTNLLTNSTNLITFMLTSSCSSNLLPRYLSKYDHLRSLQKAISFSEK